MNRLLIRINIPIYTLVIIVLLIFIAACNSSDKKDDKRKVFRYNESAGVTSLDPAFAKDQAHIWVCNQLYNGLIQVDDSLYIKPCIAKRWSISDDGLSYTFILRKDIVFHDDALFAGGMGRHVVAADFVYSFNRLLDDRIASPGIWIFNDVQRDSTGKGYFRAPNDTTFIIRLQQVFPPFLSLLAMQYCSVVPNEVTEHYGKDFRMHPVGTGPFKLKMWKEGQKLILVKNENYFEMDGKVRLPYLDAVSISFVVDKQSVFLQFIRGNLDFMSGLAPTYVDELITKKGALNPKYADRLNLTLQPYLNTEYLGILVDEKAEAGKNNPLMIKEVRQAINYGFDRRKMIRYLRNNIGSPGIYGMVPVGMPYYDTSLMHGYDYNPSKAAQLLAKAGYPGGKGLPEIVLSTTDSYLDLCEYMQHQLSEIGVRIKIDVNPPATLREMVAKSKLQFFRASWIADYPDMENYLSLFYSKNFCPKGPNYTHFADAGFDSLFLQSRNTINDSSRALLYAKMDNIIMEKAPVVVLYYDMVLRFSGKNISGLGSNPMNLLTLKRVRKF